MPNKSVVNLETAAQYISENSNKDELHASLFHLLKEIMAQKTQINDPSQTKELIEKELLKKGPAGKK